MRTILFSLTLVLLVSCKAQQASIAHVEWKLIKMGDTDLSVLDQPVTLKLDETNNKVSGHAGCNRFFGAYQSENATITFSGLGSTKMFCQDKMNVEDTYFKTLTTVQSYRAEGDKLYLLTEDRAVLEFSK